MQAIVTTLPGLLDRANTLIELLGNAGIPLKPSSRLYEYRRELLKAIPSETPPSSDQMKRWHSLLIEVNDLYTIVTELSKQPAVRGWQLRLRQSLAGAFFRSGDPPNPRARNTQFELIVAAILRSAGYNVELEEPDVVAEMSIGPVAIAAKRPSSTSNLDHTIGDAGGQIAKASLPGLIAIDGTILVNPTDGKETTEDYAEAEARIAAHCIEVAKHLASRAGQKVGTAHVFGLITRFCVPTWEPHIPRMSYVERWPVVALVGENDSRYHCCRDLVARMSSAGSAS